MVDEVIAPVAVDPAPTPDVTDTQAPVVDIPVEKPAEVARTFSQEELDAAIGKRLAREQRKWERERATAPQPTPAVQSDLRIEQFETPEAYADALATQRAEQLVAERENTRRTSELVEAYHEREEDARTKYDDFDQVAYNPSLKITTVMAQAIQSSDIGPEVAYHLGTNPKEADRISRLAPLAQAREIGRLEAKLASAPPVVKKVSGAPAPITPVTPRGTTSPAYDTTDPRSIKTMTTSEWIAADRARQVKLAEARKF